MCGSNKFSQRGEKCEETKGSNFKFQNGGGGSFPKSPPIVPQMETEYNFPNQGNNCFFFNEYKSADLVYFSEKQETISIHVLGHIVQQKREICSHIILIKEQQNRTVEIMLQNDQKRDLKA